MLVRRRPLQPPADNGLHPMMAQHGSRMHGALKTEMVGAVESRRKRV